MNGFLVLRLQRERCDGVNAIRAFQFRASIKDTVFYIDLTRVVRGGRVRAGRMGSNQRVDGETIFDGSETIL